MIAAMMTVGMKVVRVKNHKADPRYRQAASVSREFGEVVEISDSGRVRVKWTASQWNDREIQPLQRNLRTWNKPSTLQAMPN